jgi:crotonobetainyl-CoA:carnitine CoA-transferase CaiB-like acyl-CoA transferase
VIDILSGVFGVVAALAALQERARTGRAQLVRSALFESTVFLVGQHMAGEAMTGKEPAPRRRGHLPDVRHRRRRAAAPRHHRQQALPLVLRAAS